MKTYEPINVLKLVAENIWIVDGPIIKVRLLGLPMRFPTRMTIVRLDNGDLFIHSPTDLTEGLKAQVAALGMARYLVGPSWLHYWWLPDWKLVFPDARVFVADGVRERAGKRINFGTEPLREDRGYPWDSAIATFPAKGNFRTEVIFFHKSSSTLILTDFIENFEPDMIESTLLRFMTRLAQVQAPHGRMPRDMQLTYSPAALRDLVETMLAWEPRRVILSHGAWYPEHGATELRRAFQSVLSPGRPKQ